MNEPRCLWSTRTVSIVRLRRCAFHYLSRAFKMLTIVLFLPLQLLFLGFGVWTDSWHDPMLLPPWHIWHNIRVALTINGSKSLGVLTSLPLPLHKGSIYQRVMNAYTCECPPSPSSITQMDGMAIQSFPNPTTHCFLRYTQVKLEDSFKMKIQTLHLYLNTNRWQIGEVWLGIWLVTRWGVRDPPL